MEIKQLEIQISELDARMDQLKANANVEMGKLIGEKETLKKWLESLKAEKKK